MHIFLAKIKLILFTSIVLMGSFWLGNSVMAQSALDIQFESIPLFDNSNILPGDEAVKWVKVTNNTSESRAIATAISFYEDTDNLGGQMMIKIASGAEKYYESALADFFSAGEIFLSNLAPGASKQYDFTISFIPGASNAYQEKTLDFDIIIGTQEGGESIGAESSASGGSGGGYVYNNLIIFNEGVTVNNTSATVTWQTNKNATSRVIYDTVSHPDISGESPPLYGYSDTTAEDSLKVIYHTVLISNLTPNTTYYFRPLSKASPEKYGVELAFTTTDSADKILVLGEEGAPDLALTKTCEEQFANPGDRVIYKIILKNNGSLSAYNVELSDQLPNGFNYVGSADNKKSWHWGKIDPDESKSIEYAVNIGKDLGAGKYVNYASITADNSAEKNAQAVLEVRPISVLGAKLSATGFSIKEFLVLLILIIMSISSVIILRKKIFNRIESKLLTNAIDKK